jgi:hypothetical protein
VSIPIVVSLRENALKKMGGAIGVHGEVKYKRYDKNISVSFLYILFLNLLFTFLYVYQYGIDEYSVLIVVAIGLYIINSLFIRFADLQTFYIIFLTVYVFIALNRMEQLNLLHLSLMFLAVNPIYLLIGTEIIKNPISPPVRTPVNTKGLVIKINECFKNVEAGNRLHLLFKNPNGNYHSIFDGMRTLLEPILFVAQKKGIKPIPDWFYLYEHNSTGDSDAIWWNRSIDKLITSIEMLDVQFIMTYDDIYNNFKSYLDKEHEVICLEISDNNLYIFESKTIVSSIWKNKYERKI